MFALLLAACSSPPPQAPLVGPGVPVAADPPPRWPAELLGAWSTVDDLDGRWVVAVPCGAPVATLEFADAPGASRLHWSHGATEGDWTLLAATEVPDGYDLRLQPGAGAPETHRVIFQQPLRSRVSIDGTGPFVRAMEAEWIEHVYQSPAECGSVRDSPWGSLSGAPERLQRLVWMDGSWRRPPDSGTAPELIVDRSTNPPVLRRRTGAGEFAYAVRNVVRDGYSYWITVDDPNGRRMGVNLRPWAAPPTDLPALPALPSGTPTAPNRPAPEVPAPDGAWLVTFGPEGVDPGVSWVVAPPSAD